jgi:hypothetical protein
VRLKYPAYYRRAACYFLLAAVLLTIFLLSTYLIFVARVLSAVPSDARSSAYVSLFFILICALYFALRSPFLFSAGRKLRRISRHSTPQPVFPDSWSGEEVITLARTYPRGAGWIFLLIGVGAFFTFGTPALTPAISELIVIALDPFNLTASDPSKILATLAHVLPFILLLIAFSLLIGAMAAVSSNTYSRITADERGITIAGRRRSRHIAWGEIVLFVRLIHSEYPAIAGSYALLGSRKFITFNISAVQEAAPANVNNRSSANRSASQFEGGYPQYAKDARRLVERIQRRTGLELRDISSKPLDTDHSAFVALETLTLDELVVAPVADQSLQPTANSKTVPAFVELVSRPRQQSIVSSILSVAAAMLILFSIPLGLLVADAIIYRRPSMFVFLGVLVALVIALLIAAVIATISARRKSQQAVAASESVLMSHGLSRVVISWQEVRAWGVLPAEPDRKQPTIYIVMSETRSIIWSEPEDAELDGPARNGDRREVYRDRAAQLHAAIAARTGLPLREIRLESDVTANA